MKKMLALLLALLLLTGCTTAAPAETTLPAAAETAVSTTAPAETEPASLIDPDASTFAVHFIDVGQGDCMLLECNGHYAIIDAGYDYSGPTVVEYLMERNILLLDLMIATHPHGDHIGGLPEVLRYIPTSKIWSGPITYTNDYVREFRKCAQTQALTIEEPALGDTYMLDEAKITVLGPVKQDYEDVNDLSLVVMVEFKEKKFLFTGDMEQLAENDMLDYWGEDVDFSADVLKVGHHGSYSSTGYRLLNEVMPTYGVICVGRNNDYGHPHNDPMSRLKDAGVEVYRTDKMYDIVCVTDGEIIEFTWENPLARPWNTQQ